MKTFCLVLPVALFFSSCSTPVEVLPTLSKTGAWVFPATKVRQIILRAADANSSVVSEHAVGAIDVSADATGGALGYHSPDPSWKETPANEWGLGFVGRQYGDTLVISSRNELSHIHHHYRLSGIRIAKPADVRLILEKRTLNGDGAADLRR